MNTVKVPLKEIAYARSGDKGDNVNIGVIAYTAIGYQVMLKELTERRVFLYFSRLTGLQKVHRYEWPGIYALNFILEGAIEGGGSRSLRVDAQGKTFGQALLELEIEVPCGELALCLDPTQCEERYV